ncbi:MAG: UDP-N-acetylmuramoyl-L-alanine--D-glutamate ligase [Nitrospinae bacterium]|nr:UDP-N-acetylmuramoyl-L-alanine--D-glutamate ligase [Nitrospinota bacterium]
MVAEPDRHHTLIDGLRGKVVAVVGLGKSGLAAAQLLEAVGARLRLVDQKPESELASLSDHFHHADVEMFGGDRFAEGVSRSELVVLSPGVPPSLDAIDEVRKKGVPVIGEVELASWFLPMPLVAVTGTNGKSTAVSLMGRIFEQSGQSVFVGGNLGTPLSEAAFAVYNNVQGDHERSCPYDIAVVEVSSFQLETIDRFHPFIAVILNITADHLDRHATFADYVAAKGRIFENQIADDFAVLNVDDSQLIPLHDSLRGLLVGFSMKERLHNGVFLDGPMIMASIGGQTYEVMPIGEIQLLGAHNVANVLAAVAVGVLCECPIADIRQAVGSYRGREHALEVVRHRRGVVFVNDSKGTNVDATIKALESFSQPVVIILGGKDKGGDFSQLCEALKQHAKSIVLIGEATETIANAIAGFGDIHQARSLAQAVELAECLAVSGDVVLLSPACASFDMFLDYLDRGQQFRDLVNALPA